MHCIAAYGLLDSPIALCAYLLEQYSAWGKFENRFCVEGCLLSRHFTLDEVNPREGVGLEFLRGTLQKKNNNDVYNVR